MFFTEYKCLQIVFSLDISIFAGNCNDPTNLSAFAFNGYKKK